MTAPAKQAKTAAPPPQRDATTAPATPQANAGGVAQAASLVREGSPDAKAATAAPVPNPGRPISPAAMKSILDRQAEGNFDAAIAEARALLAGQPANSRHATTVRFFLADLLQRVGRQREARAVFEEILATGETGDRPAALFGQALTSLHLDDTVQAARACAELAAMAPDSPLIEFARFMRTSAPDSPEGRLGAYFDRLAQAAPSAPPAPAQTRSEPARPAAMPRPEHLTLSTGSTTTPLPGEPIPRVAASGKPTAPTAATASQASGRRKHKAQLTLGGWTSDLDGRLISRGMDLDLADGIDTKEQSRFMADLSADVGHDIRLGVTYHSFDHRGRPTGTFTYDGFSYSPLSAFRLLTRFSEWTATRSMASGVDADWGVTLGVLSSQVEMTLTQRLTTGERIGTLHQRLTLPFLGVAGELPLGDNTRLQGFARYVSTSGGRVGGTFHDLALALRVGLTKDADAHGLSAALGYRTFALDGDADHDLVDTRFAGPTFSLLGRF
ncbi:MAG: hypothetical protein OZSIB_0215 [Candidatus Ozemobacter sibiricus]|uniref:Tetratricopeptide repeat protein n=1 Tax=Candidatus Ozemobacter sibiricus TaxID=2268124 RepID=A0A367ZMI4_9BACT|nr:MAG: hypothetical protein OZSIB_0215 [Candidatus Ozemobacter sibiricus]